MTYMMRERPDGQMEIIMSRPVVVGIFPERDIAQKVFAFLQDDAVDWPEAEPPGFVTREDLAEVQAEIEEERQAVSPKADRRSAALPAIVERPAPPATIIASDTILSGPQLDEAFARIGAGEQVKDVAVSFGVSMGHMRAHWARHRRTLQRHLADGGQEPCSLCGRAFTPSISSPDKCARCSHD